MQTCLEIEGISGRQTHLLRNDYKNSDQYSATHSDAISNGDPQGKGLGTGGHGHYLPNCGAPKNMYNYSNFQTDGGGGKYDIEGRTEVNGGDCGRNYLKAISVYNENNQYSKDVTIDTSLNVADGQIVIPGGSVII